MTGDCRFYHVETRQLSRAAKFGAIGRGPTCRSFEFPGARTSIRPRRVQSPPTQSAGRTCFAARAISRSAKLTLRSSMTTESGIERMGLARGPNWTESASRSAWRRSDIGRQHHGS